MVGVVVVVEVLLLLVGRVGRVVVFVEMLVLVVRSVDSHALLFVHVGFAHVVLLFALFVVVVSELGILVLEFVDVLELLGGFVHRLQLFKNILINITCITQFINLCDSI